MLEETRHETSASRVDVIFECDSAQREDLKISPRVDRWNSLGEGGDACGMMQLEDAPVVESSRIPAKPAKSREGWRLTLVMLITLAVYLACLPKDFTNWDDPEYVLSNPLIRSLSLKNLNQIITEPYFANYAPLTLLSYALDYRLWKLNALGYHLHNVVLHLGCVAGLYFLLKKIGLPPFVVLAAVTLFAIHPVNVESVSWASERKNLLAALFFIFSFYHYIEFTRTRQRVNYLSSLLFFLLSLLSKASTVVAPLVFVAYDLFVDKRKIRELRLYDKLPFLVFAEVHTFLSIHAAGIRQALHSYHSGGSLLSAFGVGHLVEQYLGLLFFPINVSAFYYPRQFPSLADARYWFPLVALAGLGFVLYKKSRACFFWFSFFVIFLIPVLNIIPLPIMMANRYLYLPQIGIWVLSGLALSGAASLLRRRKLLIPVATAGLGLWTLFLLYQTIQFNRSWRNSETLWTEVLKRDFRNEIAHYNFGLFYLSRGQLNKGGLEFSLSLELRPQYHLALSGLGGYFFEKGKRDLALRSFHAAIDVVPDFDIAINNLGKVYAEKRDLRRALYMFYRATYVNPKNLGALDNIVVCYLRVGKLDAAQEVAEGMVRKFPEAPNGFFRLGMCHEALGRYPQAIEAWEESKRRTDGFGSFVQEIDSKLASVRQKVSQRPTQGLTQHGS